MDKDFRGAGRSVLRRKIDLKLMKLMFFFITIHLYELTVAEDLV